MPQFGIGSIRIFVGGIAGLVLWLIWRASTTTSPEIESIALRQQIAQLFARAGFSTPGATYIDIEVPSLYFVLPLALLFGALFAAFKPLPRFIAWISVILLLAVGAVYGYLVAHVIIPWSLPSIFLTCSYLCGTLVHLETEKIERNRNLAMDLQLQAERERKRIAKDLHDESIPSLSKVMRLVDQLNKREAEDPVPGEIRSKLESCVSEMRRVVNDLHPAALEEFGLVTSLEYLTEDFGRHAGVKTRFHADKAEVKLQAFEELCVYRIAQETLNNIAKHAQATEAEVTIAKRENSLFMRIADNGVGGLQKKLGSYGLRNIGHRALLIGAFVEWKKPDKYATGVMLVLTVPLERSARAIYSKEHAPKQLVDERANLRIDGA